MLQYSPARQTPKVALVHDWLVEMRGGEYVFEAIAELFPDAQIFTLLHADGKLTGSLAAAPIRTSWLQRAPGAFKYYRHYLPLMPLFAKTMDVSAFDLVISSSHCVAKGVKKRSDAVHVSYVHAPMRYMWDRFEDYFGAGRASLPVRAAARVVRGYLQTWDRGVSAANRVNRLIANSHFIAQQIERAYGRRATVVHPFVNLERFTAHRRPTDRYLMVGAFAPNKRVDLAIQAFNQLQLPLDIVGRGQEEARLRAIAGPTINFLGSLSNSEIADLYTKAKAFVFPGVEDFGITPLEAMAAGCPVIAFGAGGALETVIDGVTGTTFSPQTVEALVAAVTQVEAGAVSFNENDVKERAAQFSKERFQKALLAEIASECGAAGRADLAAHVNRIANSLDVTLPNAGTV